MRVTIVNQFYAPDLAATAHLAASLAEHLADGGHDVTVVASRGGYVGGGGDDEVASRPNLTIHRIWTPLLGKASLVRRLLDYAAFYVGAFWRVATLPAQDVIVSLTTPPYIAIAAVVHRMLHRRTRVVLWNMDTYPDVAEQTGVIRQGGLLSRALRALNRFYFKRVDHIVCLDGAMVDLVGQYARPGTPTTVIPNWEALSMFPADAAHERWTKATELGLDGRFVVLYLGNTGYGHDFDTILAAAERLRDDPVRFLFVGGGSRWADIERRARERDLRNVLLHGYVPKDETPGILSSSDCALICLRDDALGLCSPSKLHGNLGMGLPVAYVGPARSNVDEAIERFGCGVSLRHGDVDGLVAFIRDLAGAPDRAAELRSRARAAFDAAYCDARTLPRFDAVLDEVTR